MTQEWRLRPGVGIIDSKERLVCTTQEGAVLRFDGDTAGFAGEALEILRAPHSAEALSVELGQRAGAEVEQALVDELLKALADARVVVVSTPSAPKHTRAAIHGAKIVLALCGAVAAADAPRTVHALQRRGAVVRVAMSRAARRYVSRWTLQALTHEKVITNIASRDPHLVAPHIELGRWADAILVAPASATTLSRIAQGDCSDLVSALCIASPASVMLAPSMNDRMWEAPSTRRNLETLVADGFHILRPSQGIEVADDPSARPQMVGATLDAEALARAFNAFYEHLAQKRRPSPTIPWDELYRSTEPENLPWIANGLEESVKQALRALAPPPGIVLDIGCGLGFQSRACAELGYTTFGIDISEEAIRRAAALHPDNKSLFLQDDILSSKLKGHFDILLDRGTFHSIAKTSQSTYAKTIDRLTHPGSILVLVHDSPNANPQVSTERISSAELQALFPEFEPLAQCNVTLRHAEPNQALCTILRKRNA